jgi:hypothetical protein
MPVDIALISTVLRVLNNAESHRDYTEELIGLDAELILRRPIPTHQIRDALVQCRNKSWASEASDDFGLPIWKITEAGRLKVQNS